jgi:hypothetical protein
MRLLGNIGWVDTGRLAQPPSTLPKQVMDNHGDCTANSKATVNNPKTT